MESGKKNRPVVVKILNELKPSSILDAPSGNGWLKKNLDYQPEFAGLDLFEEKPEGYKEFAQADLDYGLPDSLGKYEAFVTCEGLEHLGNPLLLIEHASRHLVEGGLIIITTPNTWYPAARLKFMLRGFFPSFPCIVGKIERGTHMHIMPWSFPHLFLYLKLAGFSDVQLHEVQEKKPRRFYERLLSLPQKFYCRNKMKKATTDEERQFWKTAGSTQSIYGRHLVVTARNCKTTASEQVNAAS